MLTAYQQQTQRLLHDPNAALYPLTDLTIYINEARRQLAIESQSIRSVVTVVLLANNSSVPLPTLSATGLLYPINARNVYATDPSNGGYVTFRPWDWFFRYNFANNATGFPRVYSLLTNTAGGTLIFNPIPTVNTNLSLDIAWYPIDLVDDSTPELIAIPWLDCVKFYAAYLAYSNAQRLADADAMYGKFEMYMARARKMTMPTRLPGNANVDWSQQAPKGGQ